MEQENISDDSDSDSDSEIQPGTPPERYPLARPSRASTSGEAGDSQAIQDPEVDSTDQGPYFIGRTQPSNPVKSIPPELLKILRSQMPEIKTMVNIEMEGGGPPPPKILLFSPHSSSSSLPCQKIREVPEYPPAQRKLLHELSSKEQNPSQSLDFLFKDKSTRKPSLSPTYEAFAPESPSLLEKKPDYQFSPIIKTPNSNSLHFLLDDQSPCSSNQIQESLLSESTSLVRKKPIFQLSPTAQPHYRSKSLDFLHIGQSSSQDKGTLLSESSLMRKKSSVSSEFSPPVQTAQNSPVLLLYDDSVDEFSFDPLQGTVVSHSSLSQKKSGPEFSFKLHKPFYKSIDVLFNEGSHEEISSTRDQEKPPFVFPSLGKKPSSEFSPMIKTMHHKFPDFLSDDELPCTSTSQAQVSHFSRSSPRARKKSINKLDILPPITKKSGSAPLLFHGHETPCHRSLESPLEGSSACEPSSSRNDKSIFPKSAKVQKTPLDKFSSDSSFPVRNKSLCKHGSSKVQPSPKAFDYSLDAQPTCSYVYDSEDSDSSPPTEKSIFEYSTVRIQSMSEVSLSDFLMDDDDTHDDIPTPNDMSEVSESCSSMGKPLSRSKYLKLNNKEKSNDVSSTQEDMTIWDKLHFYYGNPCDFLFEKESGGRSSPLYEILDSDLSSVEDLDSEFSYSEIMTPQSDFLSEDQSTSDSSQGPNAALSGSPSEDEEKSVSEFSSPQDQKSPCKSSIQERLFYESHLSHDQKELILEFSSSAEKPVARSCMSQVHYISGEQSMPEWEPLCFQDLKNEVLEFSSSQMPKKPVTETVPSQDPDDDDDDDSDGDHDQDNDNHDQDDDKQGTDDDEDDQDDNDNANDSATSENKDDEDTNEEDSQEEDANL